MKAGKFVVIFAIMILASRAGFSQSQESVFPVDKADPAKSIQLYPNPATEYLNVKFEMPVARRMKLALHNIIGNALEAESEIIDEYELQLKVRDLPSGFYLLSFKDPDSAFKSTYKFLKR